MPPQTLLPRHAAVRIITALCEAGYTAYLAGGCVRDALLGFEPKDYDVATDARPEQVRAVLPRSKYVGEAFGVVLVYQGGQAIEVATFRTESGYADGRRPDQVAFTDAQHDAARRDFTINGLFADPLETDPQTGGDKIIDYVGGRADLQAKIIRAIGDPSERFNEDYLRMLRALRFAARLDFTLEAKTAAAIRPVAKYLAQISRERIGQEVQWMLTGHAPARAAALIQQHKLDDPVLNENHNDPPLHTLTALSQSHQQREDDEEKNAGNAPAFSLMLAGWLIDRHRRDEDADTLDQFIAFAEDEAHRCITRWRAALCLSNDDRDRLSAIVTLAAQAAGWDKLSKAQRKKLLAHPAWDHAFNLLAAIEPTALAPRIARQADPLRAEGVSPEPLLTGDDLIQAGLKPGPRLGQLLEAAYDAQLEGQLTNRDQALHWLHQQTDTNQ